MTIESQYDPARYQGTGQTITFPFLWRCLDVTWIRATITKDGVDTELVHIADYSVSLLEDSTGGNITLKKALPQGVQLTVWMQTPLTQENAFRNTGNFNLNTVEYSFDKLMLIAQTQQNSLDKAIKVPVTSTQSPEELMQELTDASSAAVASATRAEQAAKDAAASKQDADKALENVIAEKELALETFRAESSLQIGRITAEGQTQIDRIISGTASLDANLAAGIASLQQTGDTQATRVESVGAHQVHLAAQQAVKALHEAHRAQSEADRAQEFADSCRDLSLGQLPQATENVLGLTRYASKGQAEAGLDNTTAMTPLRTAQAIRTLQPVVVEKPLLEGPDSTREGATESYAFSSRSVLPETNVTAFVYSIDLTGEESRVPAVTGEDGLARAAVRVTFGGGLGDENVLSVYAVDNLHNTSPVVSKTISVRLNAPPDLSQVVSDIPEFGMAGQSYTLHFSGAADADGDPVSYALESLSSGLVVNPTTPVAAGAPIIITLPDAASLGPLSWLALKLLVRDDFGGESTKNYAMGGVGYVDTPRITSPAHGATGLASAVPIVVTPFSVHGSVDTAGSLQVQAATDAGFTDIVWEYDGDDATQLVPQLPLDTVLYLRAQRFGQVLGPQTWSDTVQVKTVAPSISEPVIEYPAPRAMGVSLNPQVRIAAPSTVEQSWDKAQCRVLLGETVVYDSGEVDVITTFTTSGVTAIESLHTVEVRLHGSLTGWGAWKSQTFTTLQVYLNPPVFTMPADGVDPTTVSIAVEPPDYIAQELVGGMMVRLATTLAGLDEENLTQLWKPAASSIFAIPHCAYNTRYYVAVWLYGSITGIAKSVSERTFTTMPQYVRKPVASGIREGQVDVLPTAPLSLDAFTSVPTGYYVPHPEGSLRVIYKHQSSNALIHDSGWRAESPTFTPPILPISTAMYVSVQRRGAHENATVLSETQRINFTTINAFVKVPAMSSPVNNATNVAINPLLTLAAPEAVGQTVTKMEVQASTVTTFASIAWTSGQIAPATSIKAQLAGLNTKYYVRARYQGSVTGWTAWGAVVGFTTMAQASWTYTGNTTFTPTVAGTYQVEVHGGSSGNAKAYTWKDSYNSCQDSGCDYNPCEASLVTQYGAAGGKATKNTKLVKGTAYAITIGGNGAENFNQTKCTNAQCVRTTSGAGGTTSFATIVSATGGSSASIGTRPRGNPGGCMEDTKYNGSAGTGVNGDVNTPGGSTGPKCIITFVGE